MGLLVAAATAAPAHAATLEAAPPVSVAAFGSEPRVAVLDDGSAVLAWTGVVEGVFAVRRSPSGALGEVQKLSSVSAAGLELSADAAGAIALVWVDGPAVDAGDRRMYTASAGAGAPFGPAVEVPGAPAGRVYRPRVALLSDGSVALGFQRAAEDHGSVAGVVVMRSPAGEFEAPQELWPNVINGPDLAADARGEVVTMWSGLLPDGPRPRLIWSSTRPAGGVFGAPQRISPMDSDADNNVSPPRLAVNRRGDALIAWSPMDIAMRPMWPRGFLMASRPPGGDWAASQELQDVGERPMIALNARGDAIAVGRAGIALGSSFRPAGGTPLVESPFRLATVPSEPMPVALDDAGNALALNWATPPDPAPVVSAVVRPAGGCFGEQVAISPRGVATSRPTLAMRGDGTGIVTWSADHDGRSTIFTADLALRPGGRLGCPQPVVPTVVKAPPAKFTVGRVPSRVKRSVLTGRGLVVVVRAAKGMRLVAAVVRPGGTDKLAETTKRLTRSSATTLRLRLKRSVRRGTKLELVIVAGGPGRSPASRTRRFRAG